MLDSISDDLCVKALRFLSIDMINNAKSGHSGMPLGFADVMYCLCKNHLVFNPNDPYWVNRDRLVLSCGHGSALLYAALYLLGYEYTIEDLKSFRKLGSKTSGHPEYNLSYGIEVTTGPLGEGIATGVGMAVAGKKLSSMFKDEIDYKVYVIASDGDMMEGISHEALSFAGNLSLDNLIILYDSNDITIDGKLELSSNDDLKKRFESYGFFVQEIDGHNFNEIDNAISYAKNSKLPSLVIFKTIIGKSSPFEGTSKIHGKYLTDEELNKMRLELGWEYEKFIVPEDILSSWRSFYKRNIGEINKPLNKYKDFINNCKKDISLSITSAKDKLSNKNISTRSALKVVLDSISESIPDTLIGGSADLSESTCSKPVNMHSISKNDFTGNYINYGIRENAMAAISNGIALSNIFTVYCSTFLVFSDFLRPGIRLSALMGLPVIYIMTHDSIGVGEDGPTHQPIEHLSSFRCMPNLNVIRPCDGYEVADAVELAISNNSPTLIALSRQDCKFASNISSIDNKVKFGGYVINDNQDYNITIIASGSEVGLSIEVKDELKFLNIEARVISMPCVEFFFNADEEYKNYILGNKNRVFIEAGSTYGFARIANTDDLILGIDTFGKSASAESLYDYFSLTKEKIVKKIIEYFNK